MIKIAIAKHTIFTSPTENIYSTGSAIEEFLQDRKNSYLCIKHPLYEYPSSLIQVFENNKKINKIITSKFSSVLPIRAVKEFLITYKEIKKIAIKTPISLYIGIDPLNALYGIILKKIGMVDKVIFYTADYAIKRFENNMLNWFYHAVDRFSIKFADEVWNVSTRITNIRQNQNVPKDKNLFIPNSPSFSSIKRRDIEKINIHEISIVTVLVQTIDFKLVFNVIAKLSKKYPDIKLKVIGSGDWTEQFAPLLKKLNIEKNIQFINSLSHDELLKMISVSAIGIALYTNENPWTYFCDSMKARDYLVCGLPVIMNNISSTADNIKSYNAGIIVDLNEDTLENAINELFKNKKNYLSMRKNAIQLAKDYDISNILDKRLSAYI